MENVISKINIIEFVRYICWKKNLSVSDLTNKTRINSTILYGINDNIFNADLFIPYKKSIYKLIESLSLTPEEFRFLFLLYNSICYKNPLTEGDIIINIPYIDWIFQYDKKEYQKLEAELLLILTDSENEAYKFMKNYKSYKTFNKKEETKTVKKNIVMMEDEPNPDVDLVWVDEPGTHFDYTEKTMIVEKEAFKTDSNKPDMSLFPMSVIENVVRVFESGLKKYPRDNWKGLEKQRVLNALKRHLIQMETEKIDKESGLPHIDHIACNATMLVYLNNQNN